MTNHNTTNTSDSTGNSHPSDSPILPVAGSGSEGTSSAAMVNTTPMLPNPPVPSASVIRKCFANHTPGYILQKRVYSVFIPLIEQNGALEVVFEVRAQHLEVQPGEVCFPGGGIEPGETPDQAAVRETHEELGIALEAIELFGPTDIYALSPRRYVHAFVGMLQVPFESLRPNAAEVHQIFSVPLEFFLTTKPKLYPVTLTEKPDGPFPYELVGRTPHTSWPAGSYELPIYTYPDCPYPIWGLTANVLRAFVKTLKN